MSSAIQYRGALNIQTSGLRIYIQANDALYKAGILSSNLKDSDLISGLQYLGDDLDYLIFAMVVKSDGKYYCFNSYPERKDVALTYTLDKCDMDKQLEESLASLRRLYESRA